MNCLLLINRLLSQPDAAIRNKDAIVDEMRKFTEAFADPRQSMDNGNNNIDELRPLLQLIRDSISTDLEILTARVIKILLRKPENRARMGKQGVLCIVRALTRQLTEITSSAAEIGNVVLNTCYNGDNVQFFLDECGLPPLIHLLLSQDMNVIASALGALQGICFVTNGRYAIRKQANVGAFETEIYIYI